MNRAVLLKRLQDVREQVVKIGRARHGSVRINAMDLKKVLDQTVRELKREVNKKVLKVPEIEIKVCEATSNEPWGPHGTIMGDIAQATRNLQEYHLIMEVLWKRLHDSGKNWRHVFKSLTVMEYLVANGADRVIDEIREQAYQIQALLNFQYVEPNGKDQGINVQKKAQSILALINDPGKIRELRQKAAANRDKYRGLSSSGISFKPSSYSSTSGRYDEEQYGGASRMKFRNDDVDGKDLECRPQRDEYNRDGCSCGEREHSEYCASSKGGDPNSDKGSSTEAERSHDTDDYRQYTRAPGNRGVVAAVKREQTSLSQPRSGLTSKRRDLFFTINPSGDNVDDDFDPRGTSKCSAVFPAPPNFPLNCRATGAETRELPGLGLDTFVLPVAKGEISAHSHSALEDLFADIEFQASFPPISSTASNNILDQAYLETFTQASKPNSIPPPNLPFNSSVKAEFPSFSQTFSGKGLTGDLTDGPAFDSFNPSFASFDESPHSQGILPNGGFYSNSKNFSAHEQQFKLGPNALERLSKPKDFLDSFNPFSSMDHGTEEENRTAKPLPQQQPLPQTNPFLPTTSSSAFWDDPLITSLVDLNMGPRQGQMAPLRMMNEIGRNMAAPSSAVSRTNSLPVATPTLSSARPMNSSIGLGRSMSDLPKSS